MRGVAGVKTPPRNIAGAVQSARRFDHCRGRIDFVGLATGEQHRERNDPVIDRCGGGIGNLSYLSALLGSGWLDDAVVLRNRPHSQFETVSEMGLRRIFGNQFSLPLPLGEGWGEGLAMTYFLICR